MKYKFWRLVGGTVGLGIGGALMGKTWPVIGERIAFFVFGYAFCIGMSWLFDGKKPA